MENIHLDKIEREALQTAKEIAVKFIESQRLSPTNFEEIFPAIYRVILKTALDGHKEALEMESD